MTKQQIISGGAALMAVAVLAIGFAAIIPNPPPTHKRESLIYIMPVYSDLPQIK